MNALAPLPIENASGGRVNASCQETSGGPRAGMDWVACPLQSTHFFGRVLPAHRAPYRVIGEPARVGGGPR